MPAGYIMRSSARHTRRERAALMLRLESLVRRLEGPARRSP